MGRNSYRNIEEALALEARLKKREAFKQAEVVRGMARMAETFKETGGEIYHQAATLKQAAGEEA